MTRAMLSLVIVWVAAATLLAALPRARSATNIVPETKISDTTLPFSISP